LPVIKADIWIKELRDTSIANLPILAFFTHLKASIFPQNDAFITDTHERKRIQTAGGLFDKLKSVRVL
jgi:hypothetical protein